VVVLKQLRQDLEFLCQRLAGGNPTPTPRNDVCGLKMGGKPVALKRKSTDSKAAPIAIVKKNVVRLHNLLRVSSAPVENVRHPPWIIDCGGRIGIGGHHCQER
jgi:hypothetical protein